MDPYISVLGAGDENNPPNKSSSPGVFTGNINQMNQIKFLIVTNILVLWCMRDSFYIWIYSYVNGWILLSCEFVVLF